MPENVKKRYKKRYIWRTRAEELLMELWAEKIHELRGSRKSARTHVEMASVLARSGVEVTGEEIKTKLHNWTKKYTIEKRKVGQSGGTPSTWVHFDKANAILGQYKISTVDALIEELLSESLSDQSTFCELLPLLPSPSMSAPSRSPCRSPSRSPSISTPVVKKRSSDQNNITKVVNAMETAFEKPNKTLKKMFDGMREFDERSYRLLSRLVDSTIETNNAVRNYFNSKH